MPAVSCIFGIFFTVVLQRVDGLSRSPCTREANFNETKKGYSLDGNVLVTLTVNNAANCVIKCLQHPECQSTNFHVFANPQHVCELNSKTDNDVTLTANSDVIYYGPSEMPNCALDGPGECQNGGQCAMSCSSDLTLMCHCPDGRTGPTCENRTVVPKNQDFVMVFPARSIGDYIQLDNTGPEMSQFTLVFWINFSVEDGVTVLTYSAEGNYQEIRITINGQSLWFRVQTGSVTLKIIQINDGHWHHMAYTWSLQDYSVYFDGILTHTGSGLGLPNPVKGGGTFHVGQRFNDDGTYDAEKSFQGKLSQLNVWNEILTADEIKSISKSCYNNVGTILDWSSLADAAHGAVYKTNNLGDCKTLRKNPSYDIVMLANASKSTEESYILSSISLSKFKKITISVWVKHSEYLRYVEYRTDSHTALSFALHKDVLILKIAGADTKQTRVPRYWKESPAYWHHISTTWSSSSGEWKIYLDGSLVSFMKGVASGIELPKQGELFMGLGNPDNGDLSMDGGLSRLNIWDYLLNEESLFLMANKGPLFENGNVFAWYGVKSKAVGDLTFQETPSDMFNSRANAEYQMTFPKASAANFVRLYDVFPNPITTFAACFWAKILTYNCAIYAYSTNSYDAEIQSFLYSYELELQIHDESSNGPHIKHGEWHFYCQQWRSSDGLVETWQDAMKLGNGNSGAGKVLEAGGALVLGQEPDAFAGGFSSSQAYKGSLACLNFWTEFLTADEIQGMAGGCTNVNGNLFQWRAYRNYAFGAVTVEEKSDAIIPEYQVQKARDTYCKGRVSGTYARFVRIANEGYAWRCINPVAMLPENMCYNIPLADTTYHSWEADILANS